MRGPMAVADGVSQTLLDEHFKTLASAKTTPEEFGRLLEEHVSGYTPRRRLLDALKELKTKVEAAETKLNAVRCVGKAKKMEEDEQALVDHYNSFDVAEKVQSLTKIVQTMLDEGQVSAEEKPHVLDQLRAKRDAAKAADKAKLLEKMEKNMQSVISATPITWPVANLSEIHGLRTTMRELERLGKRQPKTLDEEERTRLATKAKVHLDLEALERRSNMWFETEEEFRPRLEKALLKLAEDEAEQLRLAEEQELERQRRREEEELERKRLEAEQKQEEQHKQLMMKLEAKRLEAQAKPQKATPQPKKKEKKVVTKLDPHDLFVIPPQHEEEEDHAEGPEPSDNGDTAAPAAPAAPATATAPSAPAASPQAAPPAAPAPQVAKAPEPAPRPPKPVLECKWAAPAPAFEVPQQVSEESSGLAGPTLAEARTAPRKVPQHTRHDQAPPASEAKAPQPSVTADDEDGDEDAAWRELPSTEDTPEAVEQAPAEPAPATVPAAAAATEKATTVAAATPAPSPTPSVPKPKPAKAVIENKWDAPAPKLQEETSDGIGPSLMEAMGSAKGPAAKKAPPQPKKKEKKKFTKLAASDLGFDCDNPNY